ncbi:MAG: tripartite tricarboxylate transporter TctB family protein [Deltaproteobacteria bacterium]|nr:tripartite tricarboxylate transporter TctB family protein [Deltaproteobacteria bacterium]NNG46290.1 tripartite tricarboxylate transporter TctB family protein [Deltaproteobacteria bacterium]
MTRRANTDLLSGILGLAIAGVFWWGRGEVGPLSIMFPHALLFLLAAFSVALVVKGLVRPERRSIFAEGDRAKIIGTCAILFVWVIAIPYVGFFLASVSGFWGMTCYLASSRRKVTPQLAAKLFCVVLAEVSFFYLVFAKLLYVPLPTGAFF